MYVNNEKNIQNFKFCCCSDQKLIPSIAATIHKDLSESMSNVSRIGLILNTVQRLFKEEQRTRHERQRQQQQLLDPKELSKISQNLCEFIPHVLWFSELANCDRVHEEAKNLRLKASFGETHKEYLKNWIINTEI